MDIKTYTADEIAALTNEALASLHTETVAAFDAAIKTAQEADAPSKEHVEIAKAHAANRDLIDADLARRETEAAEVATEFAELASRKFGTEASVEADTDVETASEEETGEESTEDEGSEETGEEETGDDAGDSESGEGEGETSAATKPAGKVAAAAQTRPRGVRALAAATNSSKDKTPVKPTFAPVVLTASASAVEGAPGEIDMNKVGAMVIAQAKRFSKPHGDGESVDIQRFGTAVAEIQFPEELMVDSMEDSEGAEAAMKIATDESRLPGGSLTAAGWCAPSETVYDLDQDATTEGMLSLPEVGIRRGGLRYPVRPEFADFYASPGFKQTEAQAIAGTTKPCITIPCPSFVDVRLDIDGICIKVDILAEVGYPENVANTVAGTLIAHEHWINADVISRVQTAAGARRDFTGLGSVYSDSLEALGLVIDQRRQLHRLSMKQTMEVLLPFWVKNVIRNDLGRRSGRPASVVNDAEVEGAFKAYGAQVQWLYDWQGLDTTAEVYPATFDAIVYPAGTFVKGTSPVIQLDTIYDAASLSTNTYTGLFTEQAYLVAKKKLGADYVRIPICAAGRTGIANLTCA